jgi:hypothetical protein
MAARRVRRMRCEYTNPADGQTRNKATRFSFYFLAADVADEPFFFQYSLLRA